MLTQKLCRLNGIRYLWFRPLATYGPKYDEQHLIPATIQQLLAGRRPALTPGEQKWDCLYVEDAAEVIARAVRCPEAAGAYNPGSGVFYSVRHIVELIRDTIDPSLALSLGDVPYRDDQLMLLQANTGKPTHDTG